MLLKEIYQIHRASLFNFALISFGLITIFLISGWLGIYWNSGISRKEAILVIIGLIVAFIPLLRLQQLSSWSLEYKQVLIPVLLSAAAMNVFLFFNNPNMGADSLLYHSAFHNLVSGEGWQTYDGSWPRGDPGFGMLSYIFFLIFGDIEYSGMIVSSLAYILMIPAVFSIVHFVAGKNTAILATFSITFFPTLVSYSYVNLTDCVFTFFLLLSFSLFTRISLGNSTLITHTLLGLSLGLAYLIRAAEGLLVAGLVILFLFGQAIFQLKRIKGGEQSNFTAILNLHISPLITGILFAIIAVPYIIFIHAQTGVWSFSARVQPAVEATDSPVDSKNSEVVVSLPEENSTNTTETNANADAFQTPFNGILKAYQPSIKNSINNTTLLIRSLARMNRFALIPLALLCTAFPFLLKNLSEKELFVEKIYMKLRPDSRMARIFLSLIIFSSPVLVHAAVSAIHSDRWLMQYSIYILILITGLTVRVLESILDTLKWKHSEVWVVLLCFITMVAALGLNSPTLFDTLTARHDHLSLRAAGFWLKDHAQDPTNISILAPRKGTVALFYASGKQFDMGNSIDINTDMPPEMALEEIGTLLNKGDFDYMILDGLYTHTKGPLVPLWNEPDLAKKYGYSILHRDIADRFQIYVGNSGQ